MQGKRIAGKRTLAGITCNDIDCFTTKHSKPSTLSETDEILVESCVSASRNYGSNMNDFPYARSAGPVNMTMVQIDRNTTELYMGKGVDIPMPIISEKAAMKSDHIWTCSCSWPTMMAHAVANMPACSLVSNLVHTLLASRVRSKLISEPEEPRCLCLPEGELVRVLQQPQSASNRIQGNNKHAAFGRSILVP